MCLGRWVRRNARWNWVWIEYEIRRGASGRYIINTTPVKTVQMHIELYSNYLARHYILSRNCYGIGPAMPSPGRVWTTGLSGCATTSTFPHESRKVSRCFLCSYNSLWCCGMNYNMCFCCSPSKNIIRFVAAYPFRLVRLYMSHRIVDSRECAQKNRDCHKNCNHNIWY